MLVIDTRRTGQCMLVCIKLYIYTSTLVSLLSLTINCIVGMYQIRTQAPFDVVIAVGAISEELILMSKCDHRNVHIQERSSLEF